MRRMANILSIFVILAIAFPVTGNAYAEDELPARVGLIVTTTGLHDNSLNELSYQGLMRAVNDLGIVATTYEPQDQSEYGSFMQWCADENELCIVIGFEFRFNLPLMARANPGIKWVIVDWSYPDCWDGAVEGVDCGSFTEIENVRGLRFNEKQAGYLAGVLAAGMSANNVVGAVGGMEIPPVVAFVEGYRNGAQCTNHAVKVLIDYTGAFDNPELGANTAQNMVEQGADVIFGAAGSTGDGAIKYSAQIGQWAIGVDADEYLTVFGNGSVAGSDRLLSSAIKRMDTAVYQTIADFVNGAFTSGTILYDLAAGGVGLAPFHEADTSILQEIKDNLETVKQGIIDGSVNIDDPCTIPPAPVPWLIAFPESEAVEGWEWPEGTTVYLTINNAPAGFIKEGTAEVTTWGDLRTYVRFEFWEDYDLQVGDIVTLSTEGLPPVSHEVQELNVTEVDRAADTVGGTASVGAVVQVWPHGFDQDYFIQDQAEDGTWFADFGALGFHTIEETGGRSQIMVNGNATAVDWNAPNTRFTVWPGQNYLEGYEWPEGALVSISVAGKDICSTEAVSGFPEWDPSNTFLSVNFAEGCEIEAGDLITLSAGSLDFTHQVQALAITDVSPDSDSVAGTAVLDAEEYNLHIWIHGVDSSYIQLSADGGAWLADFGSQGFDLQPGMGGRVELTDQASNSTAVEWHIPNPRFTVFPEWEWFDAYEWTEGKIVAITVAGKPQCSFERESAGDFFNGGFPEGCDVQIGDTVTFTNGEAVRTHIVQNLAITKVSQEDDVVTGVAIAGAEVHVWPHAAGQEQLVVANPKGKWSVDFNGIFDLTPGDGGRAEVRDVSGNATAVDWYIPNPRIVTSITEDWFYLLDFAPGATVKYFVYESKDGKRISKGTVTTDSSGFVWVDSEGRWDLKPGNYLVVSDGASTKDLVIEGFSFDLFDLTKGLLQGMVLGQADRRVWVEIGFENDKWSMDVFTDVDGNWEADFGKPVPPDYLWVTAMIFDNDGDASELRPSVINNWTLVITNQPDWIDSGITVSAGQSFKVEAFGLMNPCSDTYPNGADYCIFYTPAGAEGMVPEENEFGIFPGPGLSFMALLGRIGDGEPFYIGEGDTFTAEQDGTLWFTPNDNLRMDNLGSYSVLIQLEP